MSDYIKINPKDNVAVALKAMSAGDCIDNIVLSKAIEQGHKIALKDLAVDDVVLKYGYPIGYATHPIKAGEHVHTHNMKTALDENLEYEYTPQAENLQTVCLTEEQMYFQGYERFNGRVGIRNELWVIPTVGCVNENARLIANLCQDLKCEKIDAVRSFSHPYGCSQLGDDQENFRTALAALICHPNVGGVLVLGLGCENSNISVLKEYLGEYDTNRVKFLTSQEVEDEIAEGEKLLRELAQTMKQDVRSKQPVSKLIVGMKCGGSDGLSGITANPVVGSFSDMLISAGGTTILTEVPEMFGAETILMSRARNEEVFHKIVALINDFKDYFRSYNQTIYENPSPGNIAGGITTLEDKALGCTQKSGSKTVADVLKYGESVTMCGLNLLSAPGNDLVASTALAVSGAQLVLFTTGRGTPFASPVPTLKISTNTNLYQKKRNWIDFNCGSLVDDSNASIDKLSKDLYEEVIAIANGKQVKSEQMGYSDLAIFKQGVTL